MNYIKCFTFIILVIGQNAFASPSQQKSDFYFIINNSNEDLIVTVKYKSVNVNRDILGGNYIDYYDNGNIVDRLYVDARFRSGEYFLQNNILPNINKTIDGRFHLNHIPFFRRIIADQLYVLNREEILKYFGEENIQQFPQNIFFEYRKIKGHEIINMFIEEFNISDLLGNIIIRLNDINDYIFEENIVAGNVANYSYSIYGIFITDKMLKEKREKIE